MPLSALAFAVLVVVVIVAVLVLVWGFAPRLVARLITAALLAAPGGFCFYGLLASFEPGDHASWRIGYSLIGLSCFAAAAWLGYGAFRPSRAALAWAVVGLFGGAGSAFICAWILFLADPGGRFAGFALAYALLSGPIGAAIGGAAGACIASPSRKERNHGSRISSQ